MGTPLISTISVLSALIVAGITTAIVLYVRHKKKLKQKLADYLRDRPTPDFMEGDDAS